MNSNYEVFYNRVFECVVLYQNNMLLSLTIRDVTVIRLKLSQLLIVFLFVLTSQLYVFHRMCSSPLLLICYSLDGMPLCVH
jgi:hypothetical protein